MVLVVVDDSREGAVGVICVTVDVCPPTYTVVDVGVDGPANAAAGIARAALIHAMAAASLTVLMSGEL